MSTRSAAMSRPAGDAVLLVEDSLPERTRLRFILERGGYRVLEAGDGDAALEVLAAEPVNLIVSDWQMPRMSGVELCRKIRQELQLDNCYIIMLTGRSSRKDTLEAFDAGTDDFLAKPVDRDELLARLKVGRRLCKLQADLSQQYQQVQESLTREQQARALVDEDLEAASLLQRELLPPQFGQHPGLDVAHLFRPAAGLGGDMLNHVRLDTHRVGFFLLDVCGHGVAPSLLSFAVAHALGEMFADAGGDVRPHELLQSLNRRFHDRSGNGRFFTIALGIMDLRDGQTRICQAAHPPPLVIRHEGEIEPVPGGGVPVGVFADAQYETCEVLLQPGDQLLLFSDGLTECESAEMEQFGDERLHDLLRASQGLSPEHVLELVHETVTDWCGDDTLEDDLSVMILARQHEVGEGRRRFELMSRAEDIADTVDALREWLGANGVAEGLGFEFAVCVAEALNNVEEHGYGEESPGEIVIDCRLQIDAIECEIIDHAVPVTEMPSADLSPGDVENGRGWFILKSWMDRVEYVPAVQGNRLRLVKFKDSRRQKGAPD